jgi:hypothetical protein
MEEERSFSTRTLNVVGLGLLALAITILAGGIWSALLVTNLRSSPAVPWSVPAMALLLWLAWSYLGGSGWPRSTSEARRRYLRANRNPDRRTCGHSSRVFYRWLRWLEPGSCCSDW